MADAASARYLETQIQTASPDQLLLMLFDGAIRFSEQGKVLLLEKAFEQSNARLLRAQDIMLELMSALDTGIGEPIYGNLMGLYRFVWERLIDANVRRDAAPIDESLKILALLRETWGEAVAKARQEKSPGAMAASAVAGAASAAPRVGISVQG